MFSRFVGFLSFVLLFRFLLPGDLSFSLFAPRGGGGAARFAGDVYRGPRPNLGILPKYIIRSAQRNIVKFACPLYNFKIIAKEFARRADVV